MQCVIIKYNFIFVLSTVVKFNANYYKFNANYVFT